jgi:predicted nucleotidyltransferase
LNISNKKIMDENLIKEKIEKSLDIICPLYKLNLIEQAFIVGSVAKGTAHKGSDIDIIIVNPIMHNAADLAPISPVLPYNPDKEEVIIESLRVKIVDLLENMGVEFKEIYKKDMHLWHQLYNGEIFHLMTRKDVRFLLIDFKEYIEITKDMC